MHQVQIYLACITYGSVAYICILCNSATLSHSRRNAADADQRGWLLLLGVEGSGQAQEAGRPEWHPGVVIPR